ncbi:MAG: hypothetical protein LH660_20905 [Phormidesmis sp. CAN_BIN36]|nr:hypothetical protein [Phormidesmis sp. CAN_BIN36]
MSRTSHQTRKSSPEVLILAAVLLGAIGFNLPLQAQSSSLSFSPQFTPDPTEVSGSGGGSIAASKIAGQADTSTGGCLGYVASQPNHTLNLKAFFSYLKVQVQSAEDTTIVVQGPGGTWCNDDFQNRSAGIDGEWLPGTYQIWVGTYRSNQTAPYTLRITEVR